MAKPGRKPVHQLQYLAGSDGPTGWAAGTPGTWYNCMSDTSRTLVGPASRDKARAAKRELTALYPRISYRIINLNASE